MRLLRYKIALRKEPEGGYTVTVPSFPGCVTYGATIEEAINMAKEAIELYIESLKAHEEEIPRGEEEEIDGQSKEKAFWVRRAKGFSEASLRTWR